MSITGYVTGYMNWQKLFQTITVCSKTRTTDANGGWTDAWTSTGVTFKGAVVTTEQREIVLAQEVQFPNLPSIVAIGPLVAATDQLLCVGTLPAGAPAAGRKFKVLKTEDPGELGFYSLYHVEEVA